MTRRKFYPVNDVPVADLLLDTHNPRIRHGQDQNDCIVRILRDRDNFLNLLKDIASDGLSPDHILVSKNTEGKWVVRDGNRRVTALKLLTRPALCAHDAGLVNVVQRIADTEAENIPAIVNCLACDDEETILKYLERKHTGENAGVGQRNWSALLKSLFNLQLGASDQNRRAAQLLEWVESQGMRVEDDFEITTLNRGLNATTLALIGFAIEHDTLKPTLPVPQAYALAARVVNDVAAKRVNVKRGDEEGSIYATDKQMDYFQKIRAEVGPVLNSYPAGEAIPSPAEPSYTPSHVDSPVPEIQSPNITPVPGDHQVNPTSERKLPSPSKAPWDRPSLFGPRKNASPGITIPSSETKAQSIIVELRKLNPYDTPLSIAMLLRALLELSNDYYREAKSLKKVDGLHKSIANTADHMKTTGLLSGTQHDLVMRYTRTTEGMLHVKTVQAYLHRDNYHPNAQALNTFWDEIGCFVAACWR